MTLLHATTTTTTRAAGVGSGEVGGSVFSFGKGSELVIAIRSYNLLPTTYCPLPTTPLPTLLFPISNHYFHSTLINRFNIIYYAA